MRSLSSMDPQPVHPSRVTVGFSSHRPETLPYVAAWMRRHDIVVLEEPPNELFEKMLRRETSVDDYLADTDFEFPVFTRRSCELHRALHAEGKTILQVDPFLERLERIHDRFEEGWTPSRVKADPLLSEVYQAEHSWTAALLRYYESAAVDGFEVVVAALLAFSRADSARGGLRDRLRAEALVSLLPVDRSVYVEAGEIHVALAGELRSRLEPSRAVRSIHVMQPVVERLSGRRCCPGPGDKLTMLVTLRPDYRGPSADLLAARALIHVKILHKDEIDSSEGQVPHTVDEIECNLLVGNLSYDDCRQLFEVTRSMPTRQARAEVVARYPAR